MYRFIKLIWDWIHEYGVAIQAIATVLLVGVTWQYVSLTRNLVKIQSDTIQSQAIQVEDKEQQFKLVNRAKIFQVELAGNINGGTIKFLNIGNLPAENLRIIWKIIKVDGDEIVKEFPKRRKNNILSKDEIEVFRDAKVDSEENIYIPYSSDCENKEEVVFLVIAWMYKGQGIEEYMIKNSLYLWDIYSNPPAWIKTSLLGYEHMKVTNSIRDELREYLEQEENN